MHRRWPAIVPARSKLPKYSVLLTPQSRATAGNTLTSVRQPTFEFALLRFIVSTGTKGLAAVS